MNTKFLIIPCFLLSMNSFGQSKAMFSKKDVLEDLNTLQELLIEGHRNVFAYTNEEEFKSVYKKVKNAIHKDSLTFLETTNLLQQLASSVNNGHTEIDFPALSYMEYAQAGGTLFPLEIAFEDNKALVRKNWSSNDDINIGSEILSINGLGISEILSII